jgi:hypothetical protein
MRQLVGTVLVLAMQLGCSAVTDPAVRLAYCLESAVNEHQRESGPVQVTCELGIPCGYVVFLHPGGDLTDEQLIAAGLPQSLVDDVRRLRLGSDPAIYVLPNDPATPSSRTTYQQSFLRIPQAMVVVKSLPEPLKVNLAGTPKDRFIASIQ